MKRSLPRLAAALLVLLIPAAQAADQATSKPAPGTDVCADGKPHTFRLRENRDRLLKSLADEKSRILGQTVAPCQLWANLSPDEQAIFEVVTAYLGSCESRLNPPPSTSDDAALDHAVALYSINGSGLADIITPPVPSGGGSCGGYDSNRVFIGFDAVAVTAMRAGHDGSALNPKREKGYNIWEKSNDPGGPHDPFDSRDMICWGGAFEPCWSPISNSEGPTFHFFSSDSHSTAGLSDRRGVCGLDDAHTVELTLAFNWDHESDPLCNKDWENEVNSKVGNARYKYEPGACGQPAKLPPSNVPAGSNFGLGPDSCYAKAHPEAASPQAAPAAQAPKADLKAAEGAVEGIKSTRLP